MTRRSFIKSGLIYVPTVFSAGPMWGGVHLSSLDQQVANWIKRVRSATTYFSSKSVVANDRFMKIVRSNGLRSKLYRVNTCTGADLTACMVPLINDYGDAGDGKNGFQPADYTEATGLAGNASALNLKFLTTGFSPSLWASANDAHIAAYSRTDSIESNNNLIGSVTSGSGNTGIFLTVRISLASNTSYGLLVGTGGIAQTAGADPDSLGFYLVSRTASNLITLYKNGASIATGGTTTADLTGPTLYVYATHDNVVGNDIPTGKTLAGYSIGLGLTSAQAAVYNYAWKTLQTVLGRAVA